MPQDTPSRKLDQYIVRFPNGMRDRLKAEAERNKRSMNAEILARLEETLVRQDDQAALDNAIAGEPRGDGSLEDALGKAIRGVLRTHGVHLVTDLDDDGMAERTTQEARTPAGKKRRTK